MVMTNLHVLQGFNGPLSIMAMLDGMLDGKHLHAAMQLEQHPHFICLLQVFKRLLKTVALRQLMHHVRSLQIAGGKVAAEYCCPFGGSIVITAPACCRTRRRCSGGA